MSRYDRYDAGFRQEPRYPPRFARRRDPRERFSQRFDEPHDPRERFPSQFDEPRGPRDWHPAPRFDERRDPIGRMRNRVTAPYNMDYVVGYREDPRHRNYNMYTGDQSGRIGDVSYYQQPYMTIGGTRTYRGAPRPMRYDRYDYF